MTQQLLRLPAVKSLTGMSRSTIYLHIENGLFPKPCKIGDRSVAWPSNEVHAIIKARIAGQDTIEIEQMVLKLLNRRGATSAIVSIK